MATDLDTSAHEPPATPGSARGAATPGWLAEVVEVLELRRTVLVATALGLSFLGVLTAMVVPQLLPPRPFVGAAVGLAAILLAVAAALGVDSVDLTIRGPRHIRASGGRLAAELAGTPDVRTVAPLVAAVTRRVGSGRGRVGITPASDGALDTREWAEAVARSLSARDLRVLLVDLVSPGTSRPGVAEVAAGERRLAEAVEFDHELMLATLSAGRDRRDALAGLASLVERLPGDIEVLIVALPHLSEPGALAATGALDRVLVLVEEDETPRVDLIAALDAVDATAAASEVVLLAPEPADDAAPPRNDATPRPPVAEPVSPPTPAAPRGGDDAEAPDPAPRPPLALQSREVDAAVPSTEVEGAGSQGAGAEDSDVGAAHGEADAAGEDDAADEAEMAAAAADDVEMEASTSSDRSEPVEDDGLATEDWGDGLGSVAATAAVSALVTGRDEESDLGTGSATAPATDDAVVSEAEVAEAAEIDVTDDVEPDPDPTLETPPIVVHDEVIPAADDGAEDRDPERWAAPARHEELVGSHLAAAPFPDQQDLPEDPVRVAAALQTLAAEVWSRDEERS